MYKNKEIFCEINAWKKGAERNVYMNRIKPVLYLHLISHESVDTG